jgi:two-component system nitrate/nitrite sensor histidine kinase NarX
MPHSLRVKLGLIFLGFLLLVIASVSVTFHMVQTQQNDALIINLAGRQRMLTQQMTWLAVAQPDSPALADATSRFDQTLEALYYGGTTLDAQGQVVVLPPTTNPLIRAQLDSLIPTWQTFQTHLRSLGNETTLQEESVYLLAQLDNIVTAYEQQAQIKVIRLQQFQLVFLLSAFFLLGWGYLTTRRRILQPLSLLSQAARRLGNGDWRPSVRVEQTDELGELAQAFETMRLEIAAAHQLLEQRVNQRTHEITTTLEFSQEIISQLDLDHLLHSVTDRAQTLMRAESAALCLLTPEGDTLELMSSQDNGPLHRGLRQPAREGFALKVVGQGEASLTTTACTHCRFLQAHTPGMCAAAPLRTGQETLGALCVVRHQPRSFDGDEIRALTLLANAAAIAITNARLISARQHQAEQHAILSERQKLAADMHDNLAQTLAALNLKIEAVETQLTAVADPQTIIKLRDLGATIQHTYRQVRAMLTGLHLPEQGHDDLARKLTGFLEEFRRESGLNVQLLMPDSCTVPPLIQTQVLHIIREALTNARRHAQPQHIQVALYQDNHQFQFTITDDGQGFDPTKIQGDNHLGLAIMQTRAERSGGQFALHTAPGQGTQIIVCFPLSTPPL